MQRTVCMRDRSLCLLPFDMCKSQKCRKSPLSVSHSWLGWRKKRKRKNKKIKNKNSTEQFTSSHGLVTQEDIAIKQTKKKHITECTKATHDSLTPWHSLKKKEEKKVRWKKMLDRTALEMADGRVHSTKSQSSC